MAECSAHEQATKELAEEDFRRAVEDRKEWLRKQARRTLWERIFPWTIKIERRP